MPEGDTYARAAMRARPVLEGRRILELSGTPSVRAVADRIAGATVAAVRTRGKHLLFDLDSGRTIHVWLGMPGRVIVGRGSHAEQGAVRLRLTTEVGSVTVVAAPTVEVERTRVIDHRLDALGPDVLSEPFDWESFHDRVGKVGSDRPVADVVIDQRVLSGVGNEYRNEILFLERHHPLTPIGRLTADEVDGLAKRAIRLMTPNTGRAVRVTTGMPGLDAWVYGRVGKPCRRCRTPIEQAYLGDPPRITYWCARCQGRERSSE